MYVYIQLHMLKQTNSLTKQQHKQKKRGLVQQL